MTTDIREACAEVTSARQHLQAAAKAVKRAGDPGFLAVLEMVEHILSKQVETAKGRYRAVLVDGADVEATSEEGV